MTATTTTTPQTKYLSVVETAKLIRAALKEAFPGQKFSVRSDKYAGGASIRVTYDSADLAAKKVEEVARKFEGARFDGMTDMMSYHSSTLNGRPVHFGADFVFVSNEHGRGW